MKFKVGDKVRVVASAERLEEIGVNSERNGQTFKIADNKEAYNYDGQVLPYVVSNGPVVNLHFAEQDLELVESESAQIRTFETGATRDSDADKFDYEGFLSPIVLRRYAQYMHKHRKQSDGTMRASDNWQKGIPIVQYMKSKWRHFMDTWSAIRLHIHPERGPLMPEDLDELEESLCAEIFNTSGMLHEVLQKRNDLEDRTKPVPGGY